MLILGYGAVGAAIARRLQGLRGRRCTAVASDRPRAGCTARAELVIAILDLPQLRPRQDVVVLIVPLTEQTRGSVDRAFLAAMPDGALLVNVARGAVVDTDGAARRGETRPDRAPRWT